jgi:hypothetical protein
MGKASRTKVDVSRREKIAAQRAAARKAERRRRILIASGAIVVVVVIVVVFVVVKLGSKTTPSKAASNGPTGSALATVVDKVTTVPVSALNAVGNGGSQVDAKPIPVSPAVAALTANGKPEMLYLGAEYCPYCGAERWSMIVALSRFGTFSGLATVRSAVSDGAGGREPFPDTPTFTFAHATYTSKYLAFSEVELSTSIPDTSTGGYTTLQQPTPAQQALLNKYDAPPYVDSSAAGAIPFLDFGNKYVSIGASYTPQVLSGLSWNTIATDLSNPNSSVAMAVDGTANYITAAICSMTSNQPASACTTTVRSLQTQLKS